MCACNDWILPQCQWGASSQKLQSTKSMTCTKFILKKWNNWLRRNHQTCWVFSLSSSMPLPTETWMLPTNQPRSNATTTQQSDDLDGKSTTSKRDIMHCPRCNLVSAQHPSQHSHSSQLAAGQFVALTKIAQLDGIHFIVLSSCIGAARESRRVPWLCFAVFAAVARKRQSSSLSAFLLASGSLKRRCEEGSSSFLSMRPSCSDACTPAAGSPNQLPSRPWIFPMLFLLPSCR